MIELFASAFALGLLFNATPGAVFAESLRRGLRGGYGAALAVQLGSLAGDLAWAVLGLLGAAAVFSLPHVETPMALAGAGFLAWTAWQALSDAFRPMPAPEGPVPAAGEPAGALDRSALGAGAALSLSNPMNVTYWAALGGTVSALGVADPGWTAFAVFLGGFMASSLLWCFLCAGLVAWTRRRLGPLSWRALNLACGAGLAAAAALVLHRLGWG